MDTNLWNFILLTYKWVIWKARNDTKYNNKTRFQIICNKSEREINISLE